MRVWKIADIVAEEVVFTPARGWKQGDAAALLTSLEAVKNPKEGSSWHVAITVGIGRDARTISLQLSPLLSDAELPDTPVFLGDQLVFFHDQLFMAERVPRNSSEHEELLLRAKKLVYDQQADLAKLKAAVANLEAASDYAKSGPKRDPIPEDVKLLVWARDRGACVLCGATKARACPDFCVTA